MSADAQVTAWLALINASLSTMATPRHAYDADDAPKTGGDYVSIGLTRIYGGNPRLGGSLSPSMWRLWVRSVGVGATNGRVLLDRANAAIEDCSITVGSEVSTPATFEGEVELNEDEPDSNLWSGLRSFTYAF